MGEFLTYEELFEIKDFSVKRAKFDNFDDTIKFIRENNIPEEAMYVIETCTVGLTGYGLVLELHVNKDYYYDEYKSNILVILTVWNHYDGTITDVVPKELLELLTLESLTKLYSVCKGKVMNPEFKTTKKYMQTELNYIL